MTAHPVPLFDLGNVVIKVEWGPFLAWLTENSEARDPLRAKAFLQSSLFYDFEFGNIGRAEFAQRTAVLFKAGFTQAEFERRFCDIFPSPVPEMPELLYELAKEGPIYGLSNTNEVHLSWIREKYPELLSPFTRFFASHEMRRRKPYPVIYS